MGEGGGRCGLHSLPTSSTLVGEVPSEALHSFWAWTWLALTPLRLPFGVSGGLTPCRRSLAPSAGLAPLRPCLGLSARRLLREAALRPAGPWFGDFGRSRMAPNVVASAAVSHATQRFEEGPRQAPPDRREAALELAPRSASWTTIWAPQRGRQAACAPGVASAAVP